MRIVKSVLGACFCALLLLSCKSWQPQSSTEEKDEIVAGSTVLDKKIDADEIMGNHLSAPHDFNTLHIIGNADYSGMSMDVQTDIRIEKGEQILIIIRKFGITGAKILITPTRVSYYETMQNTYYDGDFELISNMLGVELDYQKVENLLLGKALYDNQQKWVNKRLENDFYQVVTQLIMPQDIVELQYWIDADWQLHREKLSMVKSPNTLDIAYANHSENEGIVLAEKIEITAANLSQKIGLKLAYNKIRKNTELNFRYEIPDNAKPIQQ